MNQPLPTPPHSCPERSGIPARIAGIFQTVIARLGKKKPNPENINHDQHPTEEMSAVERLRRSITKQPTLVGLTYPDQEGRRIPTQNAPNFQPEYGTFSEGEFWALNRTGRGHEFNEDALYINQERGLFVTVDGISSGGTGRQAADTFVEAMTAYLGDVGTGEKSTGWLLHKAINSCANERFRRANVAQNGGVVYAAVEFLGNQLKTYWQGDVTAAKFNPQTRICHQEPLVYFITIPNRVDGSLSLVNNAVGPNCPGYLQCEETTVKPGDFIILCTDGVSDNLSVESIAKTLARRFSHAVDEEKKNAVSLALLDIDREILGKMENCGTIDAQGKFIRTGKPDNYSMLVIRYTGEKS